MNYRPKISNNNNPTETFCLKIFFQREENNFIIFKEKLSFHSMSRGSSFFLLKLKAMTMCFELNYYHDDLKKNAYRQVCSQNNCRLLL